MAAFPAHILGTNSTLRELFGDVVITTLAPLLRGGRHKVVMDNLGCVFIMGGVVPPFATGTRQWGEFVSGGSPNAALQRLAVHLLDISLEHDTDKRLKLNDQLDTDKRLKLNDQLYLRV